MVSATGGATFKALNEMSVEENQSTVQSKVSGQINLVLIRQHYLDENGIATIKYTHSGKTEQLPIIAKDNNGEDVFLVYF